MGGNLARPCSGRLRVFHHRGPLMAESSPSRPGASALCIETFLTPAACEYSDKDVMRHLVLLGIVVCIVSCAAPVRWGSAPVDGIVVSHETDDPIPGALVIVYFKSTFIGGSDSYTQGYAITDTDGRFSVDRNPRWSLSQEGARTPAVLYAHPSYKVSGTYFVNAQNAYQAVGRLPKLSGDRSAMYWAERSCSQLPSDACEVLLSHMTQE